MSLTASEMTPADIAAVTGNNNGGGWGGNNDWWILLLLLFAWGGRGFGGGFGGGGCGGGASSTCATPADVYSAVDQQTLISKLDNQTYGLADATFALNNTIINGFHGVDNAICTLGHQMSECCCDTQRAIDGVNFHMAKGFCDISNVINSQTRDVIDNQNCNTRAILDALTAQRIADKDAKIAEQTQTIFGLQLAASQAAQNNYLLNQLRPCPVPAYITCNPYAASYGVGVSNGCGCGCGG